MSKTIVFFCKHLRDDNESINMGWGCRMYVTKGMIHDKVDRRHSAKTCAWCRLSEQSNCRLLDWTNPQVKCYQVTLSICS